jgi:hypothetical protein
MLRGSVSGASLLFVLFRYDCPPSKAGGVNGIKFVHQARPMRLYGSQADPEPPGDLFGCNTLPDYPEDFKFPSGFFS